MPRRDMIQYCNSSPYKRSRNLADYYHSADVVGSTLVKTYIVFVFGVFFDSGIGFWEFNYAGEDGEARDY